MLMPKRTKHRKMMKGRMTGKAYRGSQISFGEFGLQALEPAWVNSRQIEAARRSITNYLKRGGKVWIRIFPDKPVTKKPAETRMGSGKGNPEYWVAVVKPGRVLFRCFPRACRRGVAPRGHEDADGRSLCGQGRSRRRLPRAEGRHRSRRARE